MGGGRKRNSYTVKWKSEENSYCLYIIIAFYLPAGFTLSEIEYEKIEKIFNMEDSVREKQLRLFENITQKMSFGLQKK